MYYQFTPTSTSIDMQVIEIEDEIKFLSLGLGMTNNEVIVEQINYLNTLIDSIIESI